MMHETFDELMSLKLDGLIDDYDERRLTEHVGECNHCAQMWALFQQAHSILQASALEPLPVPSTLHSKVMVQVAAPALQPQVEVAGSKPFFLPATSTGRLGDTPSLLGVGVPAIPAPSATGALVSPYAPTRRLPSAPTIGLIDFGADWQVRVLNYLRNTVAFILAIAGITALLLALTISGVIKLGGAFGDGISTIRTLFEAVGAWSQSLFATSGSVLIAVVALVGGLLLLVGWQVVAAYQRAAIEGRSYTGALTGALNSGSLEVAA